MRVCSHARCVWCSRLKLAKPWMPKPFVPEFCHHLVRCVKSLIFSVECVWTSKIQCNSVSHFENDFNTSMFEYSVMSGLFNVRELQSITWFCFTQLGYVKLGHFCGRLWSLKQTRTCQIDVKLIHISKGVMKQWFSKVLWMIVYDFSSCISVGFKLQQLKMCVGEEFAQTLKTQDLS